MYSCEAAANDGRSLQNPGESESLDALAKQELTQTVELLHEWKWAILTRPLAAIQLHARS